MLFDVPGPVLAVLCLLPAAARLWSWRTLTPQLNDPLIPERLLAHSRRNLAVLWLVIVCAILLGHPKHLFWALPLILVTRAASGYPLRRALFDERWSLPLYLGMMLRLVVAGVGFWVLLAAMPILAAASGSFDWLVACGLGTLLLVWNERSAEAFRWIVRSEPLRDAALLERFRAIAARSRAAQPRFEIVDLRGGAVPNALALASLRGSSVIYTDTLLRLLDADEAAAITAHEIAHVEHFDPQRLRRINRITSALVASAVCVGVLPRALPDLSLLILSALWVVGLIVALAWMGKDRQRNETASDVRAVELCGDPDALIRALTKVYVFARVPRRWDTQTEATATHPSLARRIRAIREAHGATPAPAIPEPETVRAADGRTAITFDVDRLHWHESEGVSHVLSYAHLMELRVHAQAGGGTQLVAVERGGRRWETALAQTEAARVQAILDRVDVRLSEPVLPSRAAPLLHLASALIAICAMWAGQIVVAVVALAASLKPGSVSFAAVGGAAVAGLGLAARDALATGTLTSPWQTLLLAAVGLALLVGAWRKREAEESRGQAWGIPVLAVVTAFSLALIVARDWSAVTLYQASIAFPAAAILPFALAAAMACQSRRVWRRWALPTAAAGLLVGIAGSGTFLHAFGRDPFLVSAPPLAIEPLSGSPVADFTIPMSAADLRLSPGAGRIAVLTQQAPMGIVTSFAVGAPGGELTPLAANDLVFLDDERVLTLAMDGAHTIVREVQLEPQSTIWEHRIENLRAGRLVYRRDANSWVVTGVSFDGQLVSVTARLGDADVDRREWNTEEPYGWADAWALDGDTVLLARKQFDFATLDRGIVSSMLTLLLSHIPMRLTRIGPNGPVDVATSQLDTTCSDRAFEAARLVCMAFDGTRTHLFVLDPSDPTPRPVGSIAGHFLSYRPTAGGWVSGWLNNDWLTSTQLAVDVRSRRALSMPRELGVNELTVWGEIAAALTHTANSTRVRLYRLTTPGRDGLSASK